MRTAFLAGAPLAVVLTAITAALTVRPVLAHPLGNFTISRYARLELTPGQVRVRYVVDMAEIPTFQERAAIDTNRNGQIEDGEASSYAEQQATIVAGKLSLSVNDARVTLRPDTAEIVFPAGQGGLDTMRLSLWLRGALPSVSMASAVSFRDDNFADRLGWKEIVVLGGPGIDVSGSTVGMRDISDELRRYPEDLLQRPLDQRDARFSIAPGVGGTLTEPSNTALAVQARPQDRFAQLITRELSLPVLALSLLIAMGLGAMHALGPGHGKTVVAAYLVGSRGTTRHAIFLGCIVTLTHTSSVFVLGFVTLYLSEFILPEQLFPWLSFLSGASIAVMGLALLVGRGRLLLRGHDATRSLVEGATPASTQLQGFSGPAVHPRMRMYSRERPHRHSFPSATAHSHGGSAPHSHGGSTHSHMPPGADGQRISWRSLLALGISGGILPCPSALVVLLTAISLHRVGYGMLLITAFSIGLAAVLTGVGLLLVHARGLFRRLPLDGTLARLLPVVSAAVVMALGVAIAVRAFSGGADLTI